MDVVRTITATRVAVSRLAAVAFVPTMGALHEGHLSLIRRAKELADHVVVSIFVNPTQFNDPADLKKYPRPLEDDLAKCREEEVALVFNPTPEEIYPPTEIPVRIDVPSLANGLEGADRPGHFEGVCRVCMKLFNIVQPNVSCFGMKDYQQLKVIEAMVAAACLPMSVERCETVRDPDGLALSSRNVRLSPEDRKHALGLSKALSEAERLIADGESDPQVIERAMTQVIEAHHGKVGYAVARNARSLAPLDIINPQTESVVCLVAAEVGEVRLIDNRVIAPVPRQ